MSGALIVLVCGGRGYKDRKRLYSVLNEINDIDPIQVLIHGACRNGGADILAEEWAKDHEVPYLGMPARWATESSAGPRRNVRMGRLLRRSIGEGRRVKVIAFPGGSGTRNMGCRRAR